MVELVALALILAATAGAWAFVIAYALLAPWWKSPEGRHFMTLTLGLAALGTVSLLVRVTGQWPGYGLTVMAIYGLLAVELWRRVWLLLSAQAADRHDH